MIWPRLPSWSRMAILEQKQGRQIGSPVRQHSNRWVEDDTNSTFDVSMAQVTLRMRGRACQSSAEVLPKVMTIERNSHAIWVRSC